jgi:hypothetical protein
MFVSTSSYFVISLTYSAIEKSTLKQPHCPTAFFLQFTDLATYYQIQLHSQAHLPNVVQSSLKKSLTFLRQTSHRCHTFGLVTQTKMAEFFGSEQQSSYFWTAFHFAVAKSLLRNKLWMTSGGKRNGKWSVCVSQRLFTSFIVSHIVSSRAKENGPLYLFYFQVGLFCSSNKPTGWASNTLPSNRQWQGETKARRAQLSISCLILGEFEAKNFNVHYDAELG